MGQADFRSDTIYSYIYPNIPTLGPAHCSIGIHPWYIPDPTHLDWELFEAVANTPQVKMIGECGLDTFSTIDLSRQIEVLRKQIEISENIKKPLLIHMVRTTSEIMALKDEYKPKQQWIIHGFRGKPQLAAQYYNHEILLSIGTKFNSKTLQSIPLDKLLIETSDSGKPINTVIEKVARIKKISTQSLIQQIYSNTQPIFFG